MQEIRAIARRLRPHRGLALLALVVFAATGYVACGGDDRAFGSGPDSNADDVIVVDDTANDTADDTSDTTDDTSDTTDDSPSTND
jgi:hypothetical protein